MGKVPPSDSSIARHPEDAILRLRTVQVGSIPAFHVANRLLNFGVSAVLAGMIARRYGLSYLGVMALVGTFIELITMLELSNQETAAYQTATSYSITEVQSRQQSLQKMGLLSSSLIVVGIFVFWAVFHPRIMATGMPLDLEMSLFVPVALTVPFQVFGNISAGVLHGFGWVRENAAVSLAALTIDFVLVMLLLYFGFSIAVIHWVRGGKVVLRMFFLMAIQQRRQLPFAAKGSGTQDFRAILRYAVGYTGSKTLGMLIYKQPQAAAGMFFSPNINGAIAPGDQLGSQPYRVSHMAFEAMFHRFAMYLEPMAAPELRRLAQVQWFSVTMFVLSVVVGPATGLVVAAPWIFETWIARDVPLIVSFVPWLTCAWTLNAAASVSTCVLLATNHSRTSIKLHLIAVAFVALVNLALLGSLGPLSIVVSTLAANALLTTMLFISAAKVQGVSPKPLLIASYGLILAVSAVSWFFWHLPGHPVLRGTFAGFCSGAIAAIMCFRFPEFRTWVGMRAKRSQLSKNG